MITSILVSLFGIALMKFELEEIFDEFRISELSQRLFCVFALSILILVGYFSANIALVWICVAVLLVGLRFFPMILKYRLESLIHGSLHSLLNDLILGVQAGKSMAQALETSLKYRHGWEFHMWNDLYEVMQKRKSFSAIRSAKKKSIYAELMEINDSQTRIVDQLKSLRHVVKQQNDFRRKSGAVTQQIRAQSIILGVLFIGAVLFTGIRFGFLNHWKLISACSILFFLGSAAQTFLRKAQKWKI